MRPKDTATRRKRSSEIQRCTKLDSLQRHPHDEAKVRSKQAASRSAPENSVSADSFATSKTVGEVESHHNDFDRYIDDQEKMFHVRDPQFSSSGAIYGIPETLSWLDQQFIPGEEPFTKSFDHPLGFISQAPVTSQSSHNQTLPEKSCQINSDPTVPRPFPKSDINLLVDQLSVCSSREKNFIKHSLERYSAATTVTKTISSRHEPSIASCQRGEVPESRTSAVTECLAQAVEATGHIPSAAELASNRMDSAWIGHWSSTPAGEEISSNSILWYHMVCEILRDPPKFRSAYCKGLCLSEPPNSSRTGEVGTPLPIALQHARQLILDVWSGATMSGWVDRFGNTSLHIAAICGASLPHLLCLMDHVDVKVNAVNNAGQTFMHVLDPRSKSPEDMITLRDELILDSFIFHHLDLEGQTFLDCLLWTISSSMLDYRLVRKIFNEIGGIEVHEQQWRFGRANSYQRLHCSSNINELLEPSYNPMLLKTKDCWDRLGQSLLHIAADDIAGPATPTEAQQQRSNAMRLNLVKHLLSIGVDVNHHDDEGVTPLMTHVRCVTYQHAIVHELLQHGAEPNARDSSGNTALHIATKLGNIDATKILLGRGANVHARNRSCEGLLTVAKRAQRGAKDDVGLYAKITACMALIIDAGAIASPDLFHEWDTPQQKDQFSNGSIDMTGLGLLFAGCSSPTSPVF